MIGMENNCIVSVASVCTAIFSGEDMSAMQCQQRHYVSSPTKGQHGISDISKLGDRIDVSLAS
jgi:hypothetical protein